MIFGVSPIVSFQMSWVWYVPDFVAKSCAHLPWTLVTSLFIDFHFHFLGYRLWDTNAAYSLWTACWAHYCYFSSVHQNHQWAHNPSVDDYLSAIAAFPRAESLSRLKAANLLSSYQAHCWLVPLSSFTTEIQTELLVHPKDYTKQMLQLYFHKNTSSCSFVWKTQGMALWWMSDLVTGASSSMKTSVTFWSLLTPRPKAATSSMHACWLGTCSETGWLQALSLRLQQQLLLSCFYHCFCWTVRISKQVSKVCFMAGILF